MRGPATGVGLEAIALQFPVAEIHSRHFHFAVLDQGVEQALFQFQQLGGRLKSFLREFGPRIWNVHVKDVTWGTAGAEAGVFGGHADFGTDGRYWDFRSPGRGRIDFEGIVRVLEHVGYQGPLTVEWEDPMMDREHGASEAAAFVRRLDFPPSTRAFDAAFSDK